MAAIPYTTLSSKVLEIVSENKSRSWTPAALAAEAEARSGYKGAIVGILVRAMFLAGQLEGDCSGEVIRRVWYKRREEGDSEWTEEQTREMDRLKTMLAEEKLKVTSHLSTIKANVDAIKLLQEKLKEDKKEVVVEYRVTETDGSVREVKGVFHPKFNRLLALARKRKNIFIYGPTGSGKTHVCGQLAEVLGLDYAFISCTSGMSESKLEGKLLPVGEKARFEYITSEFVRCFEKGGLFLLDEMDAADPNVMLFINAALSNGRLAVGNRVKDLYANKHKDFVCVGAANTVGTGADRMYNGRGKLDASTLDRFAVGKVYLDYDKTVEAKLVEQFSPNKELLEWCWKVRNAVQRHRLERAMSTRFIVDSYEMMYGESWTQEDIEEAYFAGWREDEINKVRSCI